MKVKGLVLWLLIAPLLFGFAQEPPLKAPKQRQPSVLERAKRFAQKGNWDAVQKELSEFIKKQPNHIEARKLYAESLLRLGKFAQALPHLQWLAQKLPLDPYILSTLGQVREQLGQLNEARDNLKKAVHLQPDEPEFRVHLSRILIALGLWDEAAHHLRWLAHRMPDLASVQYHLALYYEQKKDFRKALHHAKRTVQLSPKEPDARLTLARIALQLNDVKTAAEQVENLTKQFPTDANLAMECGKLFAQSSETDKAIRYLRRTLHLKPDSADAHRLLADLYSQQGDWAKALWHVRWLKRQFPNEPEFVKAEAHCLVQLRRYNEAERTLLQWANLSPNDFEPFTHLARLYRELGNTVKARKAYKQSLAHRPPVDVIAEAAELEEQLGNFEDAAKLYEWAQKHQPDEPKWRALRVEALMKAGKFESARSILRYALKKLPNDLRLNALMGIWHAKRVEWIEAEQFLKRSIPSESEKPLSQLSLDAVGALIEIWLCQGKAKEAAWLCDKLLRENPIPELLIWWAQAMDELGKTEEAAQRLERSQMFAKGNERIAKVAARLWELANNPQRAVAVWENFAQVARDKRLKLLSLLRAAQVWERANEIPKALALLDKAKQISDEPLIRSERVRLMLKANANAAALDEASKLLTQFPNELQAAALYAEAALSLWGENAFDRIKEQFERNPKLIGALLLIADKQNRFDEALKLIETSVKQLTPVERKAIQNWLDNAYRSINRKVSLVGPENLLGKALEVSKQNRIGEAIELCRKAIALRRDFLPAYEFLLKLYSERDDLEHAIKGFTRLANRERDDLPLNFATATALSLEGRHRRAVTYWRRVCALTDNDPNAMLKLAESLEAAREDVQAQWVKNFVKRLQRWEGLANETD
ncbi:MAG: tetratricopeptide repeat protein [Candidatus Fervidibacter sp.]|uniref:tetratricopeptide repeat protein n=1 Tax=Candidatus Fervidibacter sp. TaxID=3100871 RepID=UPI00404B7EBA